MAAKLIQLQVEGLEPRRFKVWRSNSLNGHTTVGCDVARSNIAATFAEITHSRRNYTGGAKLHLLPQLVAHFIRSVSQSQRTPLHGPAVNKAFESVLSLNRLQDLSAASPRAQLRHLNSESS